MRGKILLASAVALVGFALAAGPASAQIPAGNHYTCYKVKDLKVPAKFVANTSTSADQTLTGSLDVKKPFLLCNPTVKNGNPIVNAALHYVCYKAKGAKVAVSYDITDQFGGLRLQTKKPFLLCNPASKVPA